MPLLRIRQKALVSNRTPPLQHHSSLGLWQQEERVDSPQTPRAQGSPIKYKVSQNHRIIMAGKHLQYH